MQRSRHIPVLMEEAMQLLQCRPGGIYLDGTVGSGGHSLEILHRSAPGGRVIGLDLDPAALERARSVLPEDRVWLFHENFSNLDIALQRAGIEKLDGILMDLGVSMDQLTCRNRGFGFSVSAPLDMRYDPSGSITAYSIVNRYSVDELRRIFREYGEEPYAGKIARALERHRGRRPIETTTELAEIVMKAVPPAVRRRTRIHPATRVFQAIRIMVNDELHNLRVAIEKGVKLLPVGGRFCIISFHSLEDRMVKQAFRAYQHGCECPPRLPQCVCGKRPVLSVITKRPVVPGKEEIQRNPASRSARLRAAEKIAAHNETGRE
ncbi:MAG: 16S rRNA (cytosine(1402)-N(4))-methyltransferase RsmH [Deltaproteobacteria bacterium]|nr:16S rRNA (cytosine(1402)-N(4))-methyltransferase RsmH [Deltaproteobacteria bacterium]